MIFICQMMYLTDLKDIGVAVLPLDRCHAMLDEVIICTGKMMSAKKATSVCRQGRRVGCGQYQMARAVNKCPFALSVCPPKHEHQVMAFLCKMGNDMVGELLPTFSLM